MVLNKLAKVGFKRFLKVVTRLRSPKRLMEPKWADWMLYALLDAITDLHISHVNGIVNEGESLDELVIKKSVGNLWERC